MTLLVTGGLGFIGSHFILDWFNTSDEPVVNLDKQTYAANPLYLKKLEQDARYIFVKGDIADRALVNSLFEKHPIRAVVHFAAESHVDRSIEGPELFIQTNVMGTCRLLEASRAHWQTLSTDAKALFRFIHVSTDEVYGTLKPTDPAFTETNNYEPNSPYSASKAASDHLVRAYFHTYDFPVITTHCSNNYGPHQHTEKLIPLCIQNALLGKPLPIYGDGKQIRDWLYVKDHCSGINTLLKAGQLGEVYNIGGWNEKTNLEVVNTICTILDELSPRKDGLSYQTQITYVKDRPGHDRRYAINASKIAKELDWKPAETFESGIRKTVLWYLSHFMGN